MADGGSDRPASRTAGGAQYPIDLESGLICGGGVTFSGEKNIYFHLSTHQQMIGLQIPFWKETLDMVYEAAMIPKVLRYIGWDVAITEKGCEMVEANCAQGPNGMQLDGVGKMPVVKKFM